MPTFTGQISVTADDGGWVFGNAGSYNNAANTIDMGVVAGVPAFGFFHFPNVTVPAGSTIVSASLTIRPTVTQAGVFLDVSGEKAANPTAVANQVDGDGRVRTTASVTWSTSFVNGSDITSTDLKSIIQEIVNQGGWGSGQALQIFLRQAAISSPLPIVGEDGTHPAGRASIVINYTAGGGGGGSGATNESPWWLFWGSPLAILVLGGSALFEHVPVMTRRTAEYAIRPTGQRPPTLGTFGVHRITPRGAAIPVGSVQDGAHGQKQAGDFCKGERAFHGTPVGARDAYNCKHRFRRLTTKI